MADTKLSALTTALAALADLVYIVDVSDTTDDPAGSSRRTTIQSALDTLGVPYGLVGPTAGSVLFAGSGAGVTLAQDNANFFWDLTNHLLGIGTAAPGTPLTVQKPASSGTTRNAFIVNPDTSPGVYAGEALHFGYSSSDENASSRIVGFQNPSGSNTSRLQLQTHSSSSGVWNTGIMLDEFGNLNVSGNVTTGWLQGHPGRKRTSTAPTNATNTLSSGVLSDLSVTLVAGKKYTGRVVFIAKNSTGAEGLQFDFNGGTATMTNFQATLEATPIGATVGVSNATALATALTNTAVATTDAVFAYALTLVANAGGTFIPRFAENSAHTSGTATVEIGSYLWLEDTA